MLTPINSKVAQKIRKLIPLGTVPLTRFNAICAKIQPLELEAGEFLFKKGDIEPELLYLLAGEVSLQALGMQIEVVSAEQDAAHFALAHQIPRKIDALALTPVSYIRINADYLNGAGLDQEVINDMEIEKVEGDADDWMTALLKSPVFKRLPPANLQKILTGLQEISIPKDTVIIKQGNEGQFYYLIKQGQCVLSRKPNPNMREIILAQLRAGDMFGEDSLLSGQPISASVTAMTVVSLLRLDKVQFLNLIKEPSLKYIAASELDAEILSGAIIVDVRSEESFAVRHLKGSICSPFFSLRMQLQLKFFNRNKSVVVVCDDGKLSQAAAFLLLRYKIVAKILSNGLDGLANIESNVWCFDHDAIDPPGQAMDEAATITKNDFVGEALNPTQENARLQAELQELRQLHASMLQEKELIEKNYRVLFKQTEKLKELLQKCYAGQGSGI